MDDSPDPILQFFSKKEADGADILYVSLEIEKHASAEEIRRSYRKLALRFHPDKHSNKTDEVKEQMNKGFQKVGFAYAVLSDEARRKRYDTTGRTDESAFADAEAMGWDAYFETLFQRIDRKVLDEDKMRYQGSQDEIDDIASAYTTSSGSLPSILESIPHSNHTDDMRIVEIVKKLISDGELQSTKQWTKTSSDEGARTKRARKGEKEAKEAEKAAKDLGVWDEFYGSGQKGNRQGDAGGKGKGQGKGKGGDAKDGEDVLGAMILKRQRDSEGGLDALAEKYARIEEEERERKKGKKGGGKRKSDSCGGGNGSAAPPTDEEFEALQAKMFGKKGSGKGVRA